MKDIEDNESTTKTELLLNESAVANPLLSSTSHKHCSVLVMLSGLQRWFKI